MARTQPKVDVYTESGGRRAFAGALGWPGWCRSGLGEAAAIEALVAYGPRYAKVVAGSGLRFLPPTAVSAITIVERLKGDATTDFGAPAIAPAADAKPVSARELTRLLTLLGACWSALDRAADGAAGVELRKGPRGGGRDLEAIVAHVSEAEGGYLGRLAATRPRVQDAEDEVARVRAAVLEAISRAVTQGLPARGPRGGSIWTPRYFVRRAAWHALDHAWEIEDRAEAGG